MFVLICVHGFVAVLHLPGTGGPFGYDIDDFLNVQTSGSGLVRFYTFEVPGESSEANIAKNLIDRGKSIVEQGGRRAGVDTNTTVEKEYPVTTHAHTIEYRLFDKGDLDQLYSSLKRSWRENRGRKFTVK